MNNNISSQIIWIDLKQLLMKEELFVSKIIIKKVVKINDLFFCQFSITTK